MISLRTLWQREKHRLRPLLRISQAWRRARILLPLHRLPFSSKHLGRPKGGYADGAAYASSRAGAEIGARHVPLYPAERQHRHPPTVFGGRMPEKFSAHLEAALPAAGVTVLPRGRHWGFYGGTIITADDRVLIDVSRDVWQWPGHTVRTRFKLPRCRPLPGVTASLTTPEADTNYWHWTTELLPRLHLLERAGFPPERVDRYLVNTTGARYQRETLATLGVPPEKIVVPSATTHFECETLVVPTVNQCHHDVASWTVAWLRTLTPAIEPATGGRRLFLSRADAGFRRLRNEEEIIATLAPLGFEVVRASALDVAAQRRLFREASLVVGPHGSAFTNTVWCHPGTPCVEFMAPGYCDLAFWGMDEAAGLPHTVIVGEVAHGEARRRFEDFTVAPDIVRSVISGLLDTASKRSSGDAPAQAD